MSIVIFETVNCNNLDGFYRFKLIQMLDIY